MSLYEYGFDLVCETCGKNMHGCAALNDPRCLDDVILTGEPVPIVATPQNVSKWAKATALIGYHGEKALFLHDLLAEHDLAEAWTIVSDANIEPRDRRRGENVHEWGHRKVAGTYYTPRMVEGKDRRMSVLYAMRDLLGVFTSHQLAEAFNVQAVDIWATAMQRNSDNCGIYMEMEKAARAGAKADPTWSRDAWLTSRRLCGGSVRPAHSPKTRALAVTWNDLGLTSGEIVERLQLEYGVTVKRSTVATWITPHGRKRLAA